MNNKGFTLIELLVVISIIGILSSVIFVSFSGSRDKARLAKAQNFDAQVSHALGAYAVGIWRFEEGSGTTLYDESGFGNDGTFHGNPTPVFPVGVYSGTKALQFDGNDDYVRMNNEIILNRYGATLEWWVNPTNTASTSIFTKAGNSYASHLELQSNRIWGETDSNCNEVRFNTAKKTGWNHYAMVFDNAKAYLYVNGNFFGESSSYGTINCGPATTELAANMTLRYIGINTHYKPHFNGSIDNVAIYNEALSTAQIQQHYAAGAATHGIAIK